MVRTKKPTRDRPLALGYCRVSTSEQVSEGASLDAQRTALTAEADRRGWDLEIVSDEGLSGKSMARPGLQAALDRLDRGEADTLLSTRLDRVSRSVADFSALLDRAGKKRWGMVLLTPSLDLADPAGRFVAHVVASAAEYERALISARTREGMAQRKAEGVRMGRPRVLAQDVVDRIVNARRAGCGLSEIARTLTEAGVPTARGGPTWYPSTISKILAGTA